MMTRTAAISAMLFALACSSGTRPPPQAHIALPPGSQLKPYDANNPGEARPLYTAQLSGIVYATLSNERFQGTSVLVAGPGFLAAIDAFAGTVRLVRFDATTGAVKGSVAVGASPTEFAATGDGRIAVVNSNDNTLTLVTPGTPLTAQLGFTFPKSSTLQEVQARVQFVFTVAS